MSKQTAAAGISYLSGGEWKVAQKGDEIDMDDAQVEDAAERGLIKEAPAPKASPPVKREVGK
jgi:hypothetical protein